MIPNDNIAFVSLEVDGNKSESVKIKIGGKETGNCYDHNIGKN